MAKLADVVNILSGHHLTHGRFYACSCGKKVYSPVTRDQNCKPDAVARHDMHLGEVLMAEGLSVAPKDPRERFLEQKQPRTT